jgi:23S rRNA (cytosine1962-C5)-methyltransferase
VKQYLPALPGDRFDMIVMDPPTFSNSKRMKDFLDIQRDHAGMINECMRVLKPGGVLYFSTNYRKFVLDAEKLNVSLIKDIKKATMPFDFEGKLFRSCFYFKK